MTRKFRIRRVETVSFESYRTISRRASWTVDLTETSAATPGDSSKMTFPLCWLPKQLLHRFDISIDGQPYPLVGSRVDSEFSLAILLGLGKSLNKGRTPSDDLEQRLRSLVTEFPQQQEVDAFLDDDFSLPQGLSPDDLAWYKTAAADPEWIALVETLWSSFIVLVDVDRMDGRAIVKIEYAETISPPHVLAQDTTSLPVEVAFTGNGCAVSEHFRVVAPSGMFFSGDLVGLERPSYYKQEAKSRLIFYSNDLTRDDFYIYAAVSPERRAVAAPIAVIALSSLATLLLGSFFSDHLLRLSGQSTALAAIALFPPSAAVAYLNRADDHEMRWLAVRHIRHLAWLALAPPLIGFVLLIPPAGVLTSHQILTAWRTLAAFAFVFFVAILLPLWALREAEEIVNDREGKTSHLDLT